MDDVKPKRSPSARRHRDVLIACAVVAAAAIALEVRPDDRVSVRALPWLPIPFACPLRLATGASCPGCGLTRSVVHLGHGDLRASWRTHRLGIPLGLLVIAQGPYRFLALRRLRRGRGDDGP